MFGMGGKGAPPAPRPQRSKPEKNPVLVTVQVQLEKSQKDKLALLGGDAWIREQIDKATPESPFS